MKSLLSIALLFFCIVLKSQTVLADFESANSSPLLTPQGVVVVDNPDKGTANPSNNVGYFNKPSGDWAAFYLNFSPTRNFGLGNTDLTFKIRSDFSGRVFVKFWNGGETVTENWSTNYNFMVTAGQWTNCRFDVSNVPNRDFTRLEINVNGGPSSGKVYFDDFVLTNPTATDGRPVASFKSSKLKAVLGDTVTFDASLSYDFNGRLTAYRWNFGDGSTDTGKIVRYKFPKDGIFKVTLTVKDNDNNETSTEVAQSVLPVSGKLSSLNIVTPTPSVNSKVEGWFLAKTDGLNVYNPDEVAVDAVITMPDRTTMTVPCFYYTKMNFQERQWREDTMYQFWVVRFSSPQTGTHKVVLKLKDAQGTVLNSEASVTLQSSTKKGIIKTDNRNKQYYRHTTGEPYYPQGINVAWNSLDNYNKIFENLSNNGSNWVRYWHAAFNQQQLEWKNNGFNKGLGVYSQGAAAMQDSLLELCEKRNLRLQMCIFHHGMFSENTDSNWGDNPYYVNNGGFLNRAEEFFYNPTAKIQTKKLLRYIVARWAYSSNLFAWELFNEVQFTGMNGSQTPTWRTEVLKWHDEMGQYIKDLDPNKHIVTTSADDNQLVAMSNMAGLDNLQYHTYSNGILDVLAQKDATFLTNIPNKSIVCGEYGTLTNGDVPFETQRHAVWTGITSQVPHAMWLWNNYTDAAWSTLFKQPTAFLANEDFTKEGTISNWQFSLNSPNAVFKTSGFSTPKNNFYGYAYEVLNQNNLSGIPITIPNIPRGTYRLTYYLADSTRVVVVDSVPLTPLRNTVTLPTFSKGIGIKLQFLTDKLVNTKDLAANTSPLLVYPNPVKDNLTLEFETGESDNARVQFFDVYGRLALDRDWQVSSGEKVNLNVPLKDYALSAGIYWVRITNGNRVFSKKIVYSKG